MRVEAGLDACLGYLSHPEVMKRVRGIAPGMREAVAKRCEWLRGELTR